MTKPNKTAPEIASDILKALVTHVRPGVTTKQLDALAKDWVLAEGAQPYNLGYQHEMAPTPYPATICASVNDGIAHGIPNDLPLEEGDTVILDLGVYKDGACGDAALTLGVGEIKEKYRALMYHAKQALFTGMAKVKAGVEVRTIGFAIEQHLKRYGLTVNKRLCGHGIGVHMHEEPQIPHFYDHDNTAILEEGQQICIEPIVTRKDTRGFIEKDGWTMRTIDGERCAMFEHQMIVTLNGYKLLTNHI